MESMPDFGSGLKRMRKSANMSQEDVALELHMSISNVSRLETGKYPAKIADVWRWANITGGQDIFIALVCSVDISIVQQILDTSSTVVNIVVFSLGGII